MEEHFMEFYCDHSSEHVMPRGLEETVPWEFANRPFRHHPSPFLAVICDGRIWGAKGAVITPDNKLLWDVSLEHSEQTPEQHSVFQQAHMPSVEYHAETLAVLTYTASESYFHWMLDVLPRIDLLNKSGIAIDKFVFNTSPCLPFQHQTLTALGIPPDRRIEIEGASHLRAKKLVVPSLIGYTSHYPKWAVDFLRTAFFQHTHLSDRGKRIYISRADAKHRQLTNEQQVLKLLEPYRFQTVTLSEYTVGDQIALFASADVIVAPHGANMTNLLFCHAGTKVIELFSPGYVNPIYWAISNHAGLDYYYLIGKGRRSPQNVYELSRAKEDIEVDLDQLSRMLKLAGM